MLALVMSAIITALRRFRRISDPDKVHKQRLEGFERPGPPKVCKIMAFMAIVGV